MILGSKMFEYDVFMLFRDVVRIKRTGLPADEGTDQHFSSYIYYSSH